MTQELIERVSEFFKALSDPTRIKIIDALFKGEMCVSCIAEELQMTQSAISHQLKVLKTGRIIKSRREGKNIFYSLDDNHVYNIIKEALEHQLH